MRRFSKQCFDFYYWNTCSQIYTNQIKLSIHWTLFSGSLMFLPGVPHQAVLALRLHVDVAHVGEADALWVPAIFSRLLQRVGAGPAATLVVVAIAHVHSSVLALVFCFLSFWLTVRSSSFLVVRTTRRWILAISPEVLLFIVVQRNVWTKIVRPEQVLQHAFLFVVAERLFAVCCSPGILPQHILEESNHDANALILPHMHQPLVRNEYTEHDQGGGVLRPQGVHPARIVDHGFLDPADSARVSPGKVKSCFHFAVLDLPDFRFLRRHIQVSSEKMLHLKKKFEHGLTRQTISPQPPPCRPPLPLPPPSPATAKPARHCTTSTVHQQAEGGKGRSSRGLESIPTATQLPHSDFQWRSLTIFEPPKGA